MKDNIVSMLKEITIVCKENGFETVEYSHNHIVDNEILEKITSEFDLDYGINILVFKDCDNIMTDIPLKHLISVDYKTEKDLCVECKSYCKFRDKAYHDHFRSLGFDLEKNEFFYNMLPTKLVICSPTKLKTFQESLEGIVTKYGFKHNPERDENCIN
jgi:hypothetical protein